MKIELIYKMDIDGNWYFIRKDGILLRTIGVFNYDPDEIRKKAEAEFYRYVEMNAFQPKEEIIKTVDL